MKVFNKGHITYGRFSLPLGPLALLAIALGAFLWAGSAAGSTTFAANAAANLDQCANGPLGTLLPSCTNGSDWVNGNLGGGKAYYSEGDSVPTGSGLQASLQVQPTPSRSNGTPPKVASTLSITSRASTGR